MAAFWDKLKKEEEQKAAATKSAVALVKGKKEKDKKEKKTKPSKANKERAELYNSVLLRSVISENAMNQQLQNKYVFEISPAANKIEVTKAIEALYGVTAVKVNIIRYKAQSRNFRSKVGRSKEVKKAIVSVAKGQTIELFKEA